MNRVVRSHGAESLASTCEDVIFDPKVALGIVKVPGLHGLERSRIHDELGLDMITEQLNRQWQLSGYLGRLSTFNYTMRIRNGAPPHIDARNSNGQQRAVVLSMAMQGTARISAATFGPAIMPGDVDTDANEIGKMRQALDDESTRYQTALHRPSEILVIPTLPNPTAHGIEVLSQQRIVELWEATHITNS